jgi:hypothetical protein
MVYSEALSDLINENTQDCVDDLQDIENAIETLKERKVNSLSKKILHWDNNYPVNDLVRWLNELRELGSDFDIYESDLPKALNYTFLSQRDLYSLLKSILTIYALSESGDIVFQDKDGKFYYEQIDTLAQKCLTLEDKRELAHILVDKMEDEQLNEVIKTKLYEEH